MKWVNAKTGASIETECTLKGDWEQAKAPKSSKTKSPKKGAAAKAVKEDTGEKK